MKAFRAACGVLPGKWQQQGDAQHVVVVAIQLAGGPRLHELGAAHAQQLTGALVEQRSALLDGQFRRIIFFVEEDVLVVAPSEVEDAAFQPLQILAGDDDHLTTPSGGDVDATLFSANLSDEVGKTSLRLIFRDDAHRRPFSPLVITAPVFHLGT